MNQHKRIQRNWERKRRKIGVVYWMRYLTEKVELTTSFTNGWLLHLPTEPSPEDILLMFTDKDSYIKHDGAWVRT